MFTNAKFSVMRKKLFNFVDFFFVKTQLDFSFLVKKIFRISLTNVKNHHKRHYTRKFLCLSQISWLLFLNGKCFFIVKFCVLLFWQWMKKYLKMLFFLKSIKLPEKTEIDDHFKYNDCKKFYFSKYLFFCFIKLNFFFSSA